MEIEETVILNQDISGLSTIHEDILHTSTFSTTMNLLNSVLGAGVLSISNSYTFCGLIPSTLILTISAILSYLSSFMIIKVNSKYHCESLPTLTKLTLGSFGSFTIGISSILFCYSSMTAYILMGSEIVQTWLTLLNIEIKTFFDRSIFILTYSLLIPVALTIPRQLSILSFVSFSCFLALLIYTFSILFKGINYLNHFGINPTVEKGILNLKIFNSLAIYSLALALTVVMIPIIQRMVPVTKKRLLSAGSAFFLSFLIVIIPGVIGYLMFGSESKPVILSNFDNKDHLIIIVKAAYFIVLVASYPVLGLTIFGVSSKALFNHDIPQTLPWSKRIICLIIVNIFPVLISIFMPNVRPVMAIGGALGGGLSNFVFPPLIWFKASNNKWYSFQNLLCLLFAFFGILSSGIATYEAIIDAIISIKSL